MVVPRFLFITAQHELMTLDQQIERVCRAGARWVQLRVKGRSHSDIVALAIKAREICACHGALLSINDDPVAAAEANADGVHVGPFDVSPSEARRAVGQGRLVGCSLNSPEECDLIQWADVDYAGVGPLRLSTTKRNLRPVLGVSGIRKVVERCREVAPSVPLLAIGGVTLEDVPELLRCGVHGVAVSGSILQAPHLESVVQQFLSLCEIVS